MGEVVLRELASEECEFLDIRWSEPNCPDMNTCVALASAEF